ncbi:MAG: SDR family oxidoreductase [Pseudomonadota bacterium]
MTKTLLCIGFGYSARALATALTDWNIIGTTRCTSNHENIQAMGVTPVTWPGSDIRPALERASHLLISAAPTDTGDPFLNAVDLTRYNFSWVGYLSTTGVYGDHQGKWVDETTPLTPSTQRGKLRVQAEQQWQRQDIPLHIFRLAGIYGPGRGPFAKVRNGTARRIIKPDQIFSRIHVDDIAQVLAASIAQPNPQAIYNVCDNDPAPPQDVIAYAAELLGCPIPVAEDINTAEMTPMARSFYAESKRVDNRKMLTELQITLKYPSYKDGLQALLRDESRFP